MSLRVIHMHPACSPRGKALPPGPGLILGRLALAAAVLGSIGWLASAATAEHRALVRLPAEDRLALYQRTMLDLVSACARPPSGLRTHCEQQATFVLAFPECDDACRARSALVLPHAPAR